MLRSLYAGISGMKVNQVRSDVTANNIANASTTAYKTQRARFKDMLSQEQIGASGPSTNLGGINPGQVGLGAQLAGIDTDVTQGMNQATGNNLDNLVQGDGYFIVAKGPTTMSAAVDSGATHKITGNAETYFTRDGSFSRDDDGSLVTSDGYRVMGFAISDGASPAVLSIKGDGKVHFVDYNGTTKSAVDTALVPLAIPDTIHDDAANADVRIKSYKIDQTGLITASLDNGKSAVLGQIALASFTNPAGLEKNGGNLNSQSVNSGVAVVDTGLGHAAATDNSKAFGTIVNGSLEMSNVDLAQQFTDMIVSTRAFEASGKVITNGDEILQTLINLKR